VRSADEVELEQVRSQSTVILVDDVRAERTRMFDGAHALAILPESSVEKQTQASRT